MSKKPTRYRNLCLSQWIALVLAQILYQSTHLMFFSLIRLLLVFCVIISIVKYRQCMEEYVAKGDYKKLVKIQKENGCYKAAKSIGAIQGIVVRCAECDDPYLKRYVDFYNELGFNHERQHWNVSSNIKMPHDFIGYNNNSEIVVVNTIPHSFSSFSCGNGSNGTYDTVPNGHLQITLCFTSNEELYFENAVFGAAVQHCAYLCKKYKLNPQTIVSDEEAYILGFSSSYTQLQEWLSVHNRTMGDFRKAVRDRLRGR